MTASRLLTYEQAAALCAVPVQTVRQWKSRHRLTPVGRRGDGRLLFEERDVLAADEQASNVPAGRKRTRTKETA